MRTNLQSVHERGARPESAESPSRVAPRAPSGEIVARAETGPGAQPDAESETEPAQTVCDCVRVLRYPQRQRTSVQSPESGR
eukprot:3022538-Prymnesium_polylepis.1